MADRSVFARRRARFFDAMGEGVALLFAGARGLVRPRHSLPLPPRSGLLLPDRLRASRARRPFSTPTADVHALRPAARPRARDVGGAPRRARGRREDVRGRPGSSGRRARQAPPRPRPAGPRPPPRARALRRRTTGSSPTSSRASAARRATPEAGPVTVDGSDGHPPRDAAREGARGDRAPRARGRDRRRARTATRRGAPGPAGTSTSSRPRSTGASAEGASGPCVPDDRRLGRERHDPPLRREPRRIAAGRPRPRRRGVRGRRATPPTSRARFPRRAAFTRAQSALYDAVLAAQRAAIAAVRPGAPCDAPPRRGARGAPRRAPRPRPPEGAARGPERRRTPRSASRSTRPRTGSASTCTTAAATATSAEGRARSSRGWSSRSSRGSTSGPTRSASRRSTSASASGSRTTSS